VKKLQGLIVFYAKTTAKPGRIGREAVVHIGTQPAQFFAKLGNVRSEMGKVRSDRQRTLGSEEEPCRLPLCVFHPEYLGECHRLVVTCVVENAKDHRITILVA